MERGRKDCRIFFCCSLDWISNFILVNLYKLSERTVVGSFHIIGKETGWQFLLSPMVGQAFAADALAAARFVRTVAVLKIIVLVALSHPKLPFIYLVSIS